MARALACLLGFATALANDTQVHAQEITPAQFPAAIVPQVEALAPQSGQVEWLAASSAYVPMDPQGITIKKLVGEVNLILSVTDRRGHFVEHLQASDLSILDNDQKQEEFTFFQSQTDLPLRVALLIDVSSSVSYRFQAERETIVSFFREVIRPPDSAALFAFNENVGLVAPIADNWKQISRRMKKLKADGYTAIYDAISVASEWLVEERRPARRLLILVTDGQENRSEITIDEAIARALKAEGSIYAVNVGMGDHGTEAKQGEAILKRLSDATGGSYIHADASGYVGNAFGKLKRELRSQYAIAYKPSNLADDAFHRLHVIAPNDLRVRCRTGYYTK